jgi:chaperonin GroEL (HSP60 family)
MRTLVEGVGSDFEAVQAEIAKAGSPGKLGFDVMAKNVTDLEAFGLLDSVEVLVSCLALASEYAREMLETAEWNVDEAQKAVGT